MSRRLPHDGSIGPARASALLVLLLAAASDALAQSYLSEEQPGATTVEEIRSSFDNYGEPAQPPPPGTLIPNTLGSFSPTEKWLQNASLYIKPRAYYRYRDEGDGRLREAFTLGGSIEAESGWFYDTFNFGLSGYTSQKLFGPEDRDGTGLLQEGQQSYTALGEAYVQVRYRTTEATLFRQEIDIPYINRNDFRMNPKTFEAYTLVAEDPFDIEGLYFGGGHVTRVKDLTSSDFVPMSHLAGAENVDRGVSVIGGRYVKEDRGLIGFTNQYGWDMFNTFYGQGELVFPLPGTDITARGALQFTDQRSVGDELLGEFETQMYGAYYSLELAGFLTTFGITATDNGAGIRSPWGGTPAFNSVIISDFDRASEESFRIGLSYDFGNIGLEGLSAFTNYVRGNTPDSGLNASGDAEELDFTIDYRFDKGLLKDLWIRLRAARFDVEGETTREDYRVIVNYSIPF